MPNKLEEAFDNILGVGTAEAATTPEAKKFIRKQEGKKQIGKSGKVISNAGIEQATYDGLAKKYKLPKKNVSDLSESEINKRIESRNSDAACTQNTQYNGRKSHYKMQAQ